MEADANRKREEFKQQAEAAPETIKALEKQLTDYVQQQREILVTDIKALVDRMAKENHCDLVIDYSGYSLNNVSVLPLFDGIPDWTQGMVRALQGQSVAWEPARETSFRVATVDLKQVFESSPETKKVNEQINSKREEAKKRLARGEDSAALEKELQTLTSVSRAEIVAGMNAKLAKLAREKGFTAVFDLSGESLNGIPVVLRTSGIPDLTPRMLEGMASSKNR
jgi:Skp family chaperone for outer membrane proteins